MTSQDIPLPEVELPLPLPLLNDPPSAKSSLLTGLARAVILNPLYFWFRAPLKMFRPTRVDYLDLARALVPPEQLLRKPGQIYNFRSSTIGLISNAVRKKGFHFIPQFIMPPLLVNSAIGMVLFTTFDQLKPRLQRDHPIAAPFFAGGIAGLAQSFVATPFDSIKIRMETQQLLDGKHRSMSVYYRKIFSELGFQGAYRGLGFTCIKDSLGFALFFGVFESGKRFISSKITPISIQNDKSSWDSIARHASSIVLAGIGAGVVYQIADYPLERMRNLLLVRAGQLELGAPYVKDLYVSTYRQIRCLIKTEGALHFLYKGLPSSLYKAVPATALGFICYEGFRQTLEDPSTYYMMH